VCVVIDMKVGTLRVMRQQCISLPILSRLVTGTASGVAKGLSGVKPLNWLTEKCCKVQKLQHLYIQNSSLAYGKINF